MSAAKAQNYLALLETARCEGNWGAVPELVRKVRKHAPERVCLTLTAETEAQIAEATQSASTNAPISETLQVAQQLPKLHSAIEAESTFPQDRFQASVCAGWLHWVVGEYSQAGIRLPSRLDQDYPQFDNPSEWTAVCALKAAYLKGNCAARASQPLEALSVFETGLPAMDGVWVAGKQPRKQLRYWAELFLSEYAMLSSQVLTRQEKALTDANSMAAFRAWSRYWESLTGPVVGGQGFRGSVPRRRIWYEYYRCLSAIVEYDLPVPAGYSKASSDSSARNQLRIELKRAESAYEALLLDETEFPRADEEREEVEEFVALVMKNWEILCGRGWKESDLGQGGRESISRGVLDILYRAATKTYQSTAILRCLVTVHLAVAEFDLAFKAFDAYLDVVKKAQARVNKTGIPEPSLDNDATVLQTISQAVIGLCRFGKADAIEKAYHISAELEDMMAHLPQFQPQSELPTPVDADGVPLHVEVPGRVLAFAWQAIGIAHASWARVTPDAPLRSEIQAKAVRSLRKSLSPAFGRSRDVQSLYSLGLLLAERRDIGSAIEVVKAGLVANKAKEFESSLVYGPYWQERSLISLWHLLALLLSARQDFVMAAKACEGAFEQFKDTTVLFGQQQTFRSEHLKDQQPQEGMAGLVDDMDDSEREGILEVKMTQLALLELLEGPEVAVNASYELLTLYSRLFGTNANSTPVKPSLEPPAALVPPKSATGTMRSFRGSFFGSRAAKTAAGAPGTALSLGPTAIEQQMAALSVAPGSPTGPAPAIQVTGDSAAAQRVVSGRSSRRNSLRKRDVSTSGGPRRASSVGPHSGVPDSEALFSPEGEASPDAFALSFKRQGSIASAFVKRQNAGSLDAFIASKTKTSEQLADHAAEGSFSLPPPLPLVVFAKDEEKRQRTVILVKLWLMIAGFYRRADMAEDAKGSVAEARKLVQSLEADLAKDATGSLILKSPKWAEKRSVDELWADVWSELGQISLADGQPLTARDQFESALTQFPNHAAGIVGLSNILLDIYTEDLIPKAYTTTDLVDTASHNIPATATKKPATKAPATISPVTNSSQYILPSEALGLGPDRPTIPPTNADSDNSDADSESSGVPPLPTPFQPALALPHLHAPPEPRPSSLPYVDRLAARDRAYGLLSSLTKRGNGWNCSEAWFALSRSYELSGQVDKAKEILWWCVDLEEGRAIREWSVLGDDGYLL